MKDLYINVISRFRFLPNEIRSFSYNQNNFELAARLQQAYNYFKQMSGCTELTFMQFYSKLEKTCSTYGQSIYNCYAREQQFRPFIFIGAYNMSVMLIQQNKMPNLLLIESKDSYSAVREFIGKMGNLGIRLERNNCIPFNGQYLVNQGGMMVNCGIFIYPFSEKEYMKVRDRREVDFKHLHDPSVMLCPMFTPLLTNFIITLLKKRSVKGREKAKSLPDKLDKKTIEEEKNCLNSKLRNRLVDFENSLDALLSLHNIPV